MGTQNGFDDFGGVVLPHPLDSSCDYVGEHLLYEDIPIRPVKRRKIDKSSARSTKVERNSFSMFQSMQAMTQFENSCPTCNLREQISHSSKDHDLYNHNHNDWIYRNANRNSNSQSQCECEHRYQHEYDPNDEHHHEGDEQYKYDDHNYLRKHKENHYKHRSDDNKESCGSCDSPSGRHIPIDMYDNHTYQHGGLSNQALHSSISAGNLQSKFNSQKYTLFDSNEKTRTSDRKCGTDAMFMLVFSHNSDSRLTLENYQEQMESFVTNVNRQDLLPILAVAHKPFLVDVDLLEQYYSLPLAERTQILDLEPVSFVLTIKMEWGYKSHENALSGIESTMASPESRQLDKFFQATDILHYRQRDTHYSDMTFDNLGELNEYWKYYINGGLIMPTDDADVDETQEVFISIDWDEFKRGQQMLIQNLWRARPSQPSASEDIGSPTSSVADEN